MPDRQPLVSPRPTFSAARIALIYFVFSFIWIYSGDRLVMLYTNDVRLLTRFQTYKGLLFIFLSAALIFFLVRQALRASQRAQRSVEKSERRLHNIIQGTQAGTWEWNVQSGAVLFNERWAEMAGYQLAELAPHTIETWQRLAHPDDLKKAQQLLACHFAGQLDYYRCEARVRHKHGHWLWVLDCGQVVEWQDGQPLLMAGTHQDITAIKQVQEALQLKNEEMERFVYTISHDLKSPLVTVKSFLGLLRQDIEAADAKHIAADIDYIDAATEKMEQLMAALLQLSRVGRMSNPPRRVTVTVLVDECLAALAGAIQLNHINVTVVAGDLQLYGDPLALAQIWQNLIENAIKYRGDQPAPSIEIGAEGTSAEAVFYVRDNGLGVAPAQLEKIFDLFVQLDGHSDGSGLGLALIKKIVQLYGGRIWAESAGIGQGSCFYFTLPRAVVVDDSAAIDITTTAAGNGEGGKIPG